MIPLRDEDPLEERLRRLLRLPGEPPDPNPAVWEENEIHFLSGREQEKARQRWIAEDYRADLARQLAAAMRGSWARSLGRKALLPLKRRRLERALRSTPYLIFSSNRVEDDTPWAVEGHLLFEGGSLPMVLLAAGGLAEHVSLESTGKDYLFCRDNDLVFRDDWIVFPGHYVDALEAEKALRAWYFERQKDDRHHPVQRGEHPDIRVIF